MFAKCVVCDCKRSQPSEAFGMFLRSLLEFCSEGVRENDLCRRGYIVAIDLLVKVICIVAIILVFARALSVILICVVAFFLVCTSVRD